VTEYLSTEYAVGWVKMTPPLGSSPPPGDVHSEGGQLRTGVHETVGGGHSDDFRHMEWLGPSLVGRAVNLSVSGGNHGGELPVTGEVRNGRALLRCLLDHVEAQRVKLLEVFFAADVDGSRQLQLTEWRDTLDLMDVEVSEVDARRMFLALDADNSGKS
jgi:hypothetical protein